MRSWAGLSTFAASLPCDVIRLGEGKSHFPTADHSDSDLCCMPSIRVSALLFPRTTTSAIVSTEETMANEASRIISILDAELNPSPSTRKSKFCLKITAGDKEHKTEEIKFDGQGAMPKWSIKMDVDDLDPQTVVSWKLYGRRCLCLKLLGSVEKKLSDLFEGGTASSASIDIDLFNGSSKIAVLKISVKSNIITSDVTNTSGPSAPPRLLHTGTQQQASQANSSPEITSPSNTTKNIVADPVTNSNKPSAHSELLDNGTVQQAIQVGSSSEIVGSSNTPKNVVVDPVTNPNTPPARSEPLDSGTLQQASQVTRLSDITCPSDPTKNIVVDPITNSNKPPARSGLLHTGTQQQTSQANGSSGIAGPSNTPKNIMADHVTNSNKSSARSELLGSVTLQQASQVIRSSETAALETPDESNIANPFMNQHVLAVKKPSEILKFLDNSETLGTVLKAVNGMISTLAAVHPAATVAWGLLSVGLKVVQKQRDTNQAVLHLYEEMISVYKEFFVQADHRVCYFH
ncbi:hypothetical protein IW262DRAFT_274070 [Armillaria fumosa]|nr:hypothetical protein IW262DRAFT_274070 [Armillaria fumosa]